MSSPSAGGHGVRGARILGALGRWVVRHPWIPVIVWIAMLLVSLPFLTLLGSVTTNTTVSPVSSAPSSQANAELAQLFPNSTGGASSILLLTGTNVTNAEAQATVMNITRAVATSPRLSDVQSVSNVYTAYAGYLSGQAQLAAAILGGAQSSTPPLTGSVNQTSGLLWGPVALYLTNWGSLVTHYPVPTQANYPAYEATASQLGPGSPADAVLTLFYDGAGSSGAGFNGTPDCGAVPANVTPCAEAVARANLGPSLPGLLPPAAQPVGQAVLGNLGVGNFTSWPSVRFASSVVLSAQGLPATWFDRVWAAFPAGIPSAAAADAWANSTVQNSTLATEPLPVPYALSAAYVDPTGTATIISVDFALPDAYTNSSGGQPIFSDLATIDAIVPPVLHASDPTGSLSYVQTGPAPLDKVSQDSVNSSLMLVLPLAVGLLLGIAMIYFRSPLTPLVTFGALSIALILGLAGVVLLGTLVSHVASTSLTLLEVFVLGVGTDYSIFLVARYREELTRGTAPDDAIVESVTWAGQAVATSGSTAIIATLALTFSGVQLLAQWGSVLSLAILITLLMSLTLVPASLKLIGPRILWPQTGERFRRRAARTNERAARGETYFYRVGRVTRKRPGRIVGTILLLSIPLILLAVMVPLSYDYYQQLPKGYSATEGLLTYGDHFGPGAAVPSFALVTFSAPLLGPGNTTNAAAFHDLAALTGLAENTSGIAKVQSPVGPDGAPLSAWLHLSSAPVAVRTNLLGVLASFVGTDGRTALLSLQTSSTGLSYPAVQSVQAVQSSFEGYARAHPEITKTAFGGGAPSINDLAVETENATNILILAVTLGLIAVLLVVLRSWIIAVMAIATIGLSISWAWAISYLIFDELLGYPLFFLVRTLLFILVLGLGIDYNIFLLTRVREERVRGRSAGDAAVEGVARTGGIITAAAIILGAAFAALLIGSFTLIRAIGLSVAIAVILDAMVVRTYLVPSALQLLGERVWSLTGRKPGAPARPGAGPETAPAPGPTRTE